MRKKENNKIIKFRSKREIQWRKRAKKAGIAFLVLLFNIIGCMNLVHANQMESAHIYSIGSCGSLLTYKGVPVIVSYVEYTKDGAHYPAYCMDKTKPGAEKGEYTVSISETIKDVGLWRTIINGYPYKTIEELGVANKEEAFTATKQAVYCYIHGNRPEDYGAIGEAGVRTLNAMKAIIQNANNSSETKISSTISINKIDKEWKQDKKDAKYVSKTYEVTAGANIQNYKITMSKGKGQDLGGMKLTDENNQEKTEFAPNERFKVLIPIKNLTQNGSFHLSVEAKVKTKPVLYGLAPNSGYQDYAVTTISFEDGTGNRDDEYYKNETKIRIIKKDQETGKTLKGVEFELLDQDKKVVYSDLKTDEEGKIEINNLIPGTYYLKETKTIDDYELYKELIPVEVSLNQEVTVTVHNQKEEKPKIEKRTQNSKQVSSKAVRKLPVTGM